MMAGRYAHAKQFNRHRRQLRILRQQARTAGSVTSGRKIAGHQDIEAGICPSRWRAPVRSEANNSVSVAGSSIPSMPPRPSASREGKASAPYEFGSQGLPSSPPTPAPRAVSSCCMPSSAARQPVRRAHPARRHRPNSKTHQGREIECAYVDKGYRGHDTVKIHAESSSRDRSAACSAAHQTRAADDDPRSSP